LKSCCRSRSLWRGA